MQTAPFAPFSVPSDTVSDGETVNSLGSVVSMLEIERGRIRVNKQKSSGLYILSGVKKYLIDTTLYKEPKSVLLLIYEHY